MNWQQCRMLCMMPFIPFTTQFWFQFCQIMSLLVVHFCAMPTLEMCFSSIHWSVWNGFLSSRVRKQNVWHFQTQDHYKHLSESETSYSNALNLKKTKTKTERHQQQFDCKAMVRPKLHNQTHRLTRIRMGSVMNLLVISRISCGSVAEMRRTCVAGGR